LKQARKKRSWWWRILRGCLLVLAGLYALCALLLLLLRWVDPPLTAVHVQRRVEALLRHQRYRQRYVFVPIGRISTDLQHAAIAAEDGRFYEHHGIDWQEVRKVVAADIEKGRVSRGASTITQQLVKNLFFTTHRNPLRKVVEFTVAPMAEAFLPKKRILELYLNVIEWWPGIYGAEAAARNYYGVPASRLGRDQAARLAAVIPSPLRWKPDRMDDYSAEILWRMGKMGW
jgi:monofunctional biosynthetic peptidoglycan transglycosylase